MKADLVTRGYNSTKLLQNLDKSTFRLLNFSTTIMRSHKVKTISILREKLFSTD